VENWNWSWCMQSSAAIIQETNWQEQPNDCFSIITAAFDTSHEWFGMVLKGINGLSMLRGSLVSVLMAVKNWTWRMQFSAAITQETNSQ
jgi:hypothetical protein